jgi:prevent-host-death family protein|tara:strand:- start:36553 stop:36768 length:216 start_codon:yes stop_codon:yes gene_type:complete
MIVESIPISRLKREMNLVFRKLARNRVVAYIVTRKGRPVTYLVSISHFESLLMELSNLAGQLERLDIDDSI